MLTICLGWATIRPCASSVADDYARGVHLYLQGQWEEAIGVLSPVASDADPSLVDDANYTVATCLSNLGRYSEALALYQKVQGSSGKSDILSGCRKGIVDCYESMNDWNSGLNLCQKYATEFPDEADLWQYHAAYCEKNLGKYPEALALYQKVEANSSDKARKHNSRVCIMGCYESMSDWIGYLAVCQKYTAEVPDEADVWQYNAAVALSRLARQSEALSLYQKLEAGSTDKETRLASRKGIISCYQTMNDWSSALDLCEEYAEDFPDEADEWQYQAALCLTSLNRREECFDRLDQLIAGQSRLRADALLFKAELVSQNAEHEAAIALLNKVVTEYPNSIHAKEAQLNVGIAMLNQGKFADAEAYYGKLVLTNPNDARWEFGLAYCDYRRGRFAKAQSAFEQVLLKSPESSVRLVDSYFYGQCCMSLGDGQTAIATFQEILDKFPWTGWAEEARICLKQLQTQYSKSGVKRADADAGSTVLKQEPILAVAAITGDPHPFLLNVPTVTAKDHQKSEVK